MAQVVTHLGCNKSSPKETNNHAEAITETEAAEDANGGVALAHVSDPTGAEIINANTTKQLGLGPTNEVRPLGSQVSAQD